MRYAALTAIRPRAPLGNALGPPLAGHGWRGDSASMSYVVGRQGADTCKIAKFYRILQRHCKVRARGFSANCGSPVPHSP